MGDWNYWGITLGSVATNSDDYCKVRRHQLELPAKESTQRLGFSLLSLPRSCLCEICLPAARVCNLFLFAAP